jgi:hypothetical protein
MRKNPIRQGEGEYVLGTPEFRTVKLAGHDDGFVGEPNCTAYRNKEKKMSGNLGEFERLLGHATLRLWSKLPREVQEKLFETAVPLDPMIRNRLAIFLHDRQPRTTHPAKPTELA